MPSDIVVPPSELERPPSLQAEPLSAVDYAWLRMDDPTNLMMISGVLVFDEPLALDKVKAVVAERLLHVKRFREKVVGLGGGRPRWEPDPAFDLDAHVVEQQLPAPGDDAVLREAVSDLMSRPLDPARPLWCFHLLHGYRGGTALMGRLHHCIGDGMALVMVLLSLTDRTPTPAASEAERSDDRHLNPFRALFTHSKDALHHVREVAETLMPEGMRLLLRPLEAMQKVNPVVKGVASLDALGRLTLRPPDPPTAFRGPLGVAKRAAWSAQLPVEEVRRLASTLGATINDVLLTAMSGGLRRYLAHRGPVSEQLSFRAAVPVNLRPFEQMAALGNQFGLVFLGLPVGIADPRARLAELKRRMEALKRSAEPLVAYRILQGLGLSPRPVQKAVVRLIATKATAVMTNVPGPRETIYMAGQAISSIFFWVPQAGRVGLGISILSYAGQVRLGVGTDAGLVPDPEEIVSGFDEELALMHELSRGSEPRSAPAGVD